MVAHARAIADERERGPARSRVQTANGRWLVLEATALLDQRGGPPRVALVLQPAGGWELAPLIAEAYGLSSREQEVTRLLARGLGSADIGTELFLSVHTVRDHVKQILEKVGVSSRGELIARLFNDHYLGRMVESVQRRQF
ncbi:MAG: helix-turn-helix transcriptional regulator [Actinobacteria bacterium]|nr:helix-turn-helix transcriptional regulator [Actinomycetota bacterium]